MKIRFEAKVFCAVLFVFLLVISITYIKSQSNIIEENHSQLNAKEEVLKCYSQIAKVAIKNENQQDTTNLTIDQHCTFADGSVIKKAEITYDYLKTHNLVYWNLNNLDTDNNFVGTFNLETGNKTIEESTISNYKK